MSRELIPPAFFMYVMFLRGGISFSVARAMEMEMSSPEFSFAFAFAVNMLDMHSPQQQATKRNIIGDFFSGCIV